MKKILSLFIAVSFIFITGCTKKEEKNNMSQSLNPAVKSKLEEPKSSTVDPSKKYVAVIHTSKGDITCELFAKDAPLSATNFKQLADNGFYNGLTFHRVVPGFVVQGGDPTGTGAGGPGYTIPAEIGKNHAKGALAWARTSDMVNPERRSSGSQFYIALVDLPQLDGQYSVFGQTIGGMDVVEKIQMGDTINSVEVKEE